MQRNLVTANGSRHEESVFLHRPESLRTAQPVAEAYPASMTEAPPDACGTVPDKTQFACNSPSASPPLRNRVFETPPLPCGMTFELMAEWLSRLLRIKTAC